MVIRFRLSFLAFMSLMACQHSSLGPEDAEDRRSEFDFTAAYTAYDLGALDEAGSVAYDINGHGWTVGGAGGTAVLWNPQREIRPLDAVDGNPWSRAVAVNDQGLIAGTVGPTSNSPPADAVVWSTDGSVRRVLPRLPEAVECQAMDISGDDDVVGFCRGDASPRRAVLWPAQGGVIDLPQLPGTDRSVAHGFNRQGEIVGTSGTTGGASDRPTLWSYNDGEGYSVTALFEYEGEELRHIAINKFREVAGTFLQFHGFHWSDETGLTLQTGCADSEITDINDAGTMVGFCDSPPFAYLWGGAGDPQYLPLPAEYDHLDPFSFSTGALAINERGDIVGYGAYSGSAIEPGMRAYLWVPQPP